MINISSVLFQDMLEKKHLKLTGYIRLTTLILGLSGCQPNLLSQKESTAYTRYETLADYNLQLGLAYLEANDIVNAKAKLLLAERKNPNNAMIKSAIAYLLEVIGEIEKAEAYHLKAIQLDKKGGAAHNNYGRFLCECNRYTEAEQHFLKAVQDVFYLNIASAYENAGLCAIRTFDKDKATRYLKSAVKHNPHLEKSWFSLARLHIDNLQLADEYFQKYQTTAVCPTPSALALGVQIAQKLNKQKMAGYYALILKEKYPKSREYQAILSTHPELIKNK